MIDVATGAALVYVALLLYVMGARWWERSYGRDAERPKLPERPPLRIELPSHPHSNLGWKQSGASVHIACRAADPEATRALDPDVTMGAYLCRDCKKELRRHGEAWKAWTYGHNEAVASYKAETRSPWLWPVWVLLRPAEIVGRPALVKDTDR